MKKLNRQRGFTLIELLVVVSIIALLAVGVMPLYGKIMLKVKANAAMKNAHQIQEALVAYATTHDSVFPNSTPSGGEINDANTAFRQLFVSGLIDNEDLFYVQGSMWHPQNGNKKPDGDMGDSASEYDQAVSAGENHWSYVTGLSHDRSESVLPIIADGGMDGSPGVWSGDEKVRGGVWKGKHAITARIGGNVKVNDLSGSQLVVKDKHKGQDVDIFSDTYGTVVANHHNPLGQ